MEIICDKCGAVMENPIQRSIRTGDIEHTYFICKTCGEPYLISTTDSALRRNIEKYRKMAQRLRKGKCTEEYHRKVQKLKEENRRRSRELAAEHGLAPLLLKE